MKPVSKTKKITFFALALVLAVPGIITYFEPFAPRYEGKTVKQWVNFYSQLETDPENDVIQAFGTNSLKTLILFEQPSLWLKVFSKMNTLIGHPVWLEDSNPQR